jgi:hypothetical protein
MAAAGLAGDLMGSNGCFCRKTPFGGNLGIVRNWVDCVEEVGAVRGLIGRCERRERGRYRSGRYRMHRHRDDLGHFAQVLGGGGEEELVFGAIWSP